jgi:ABC-type transporter Mla subunit MlaD
MRRLAVIFGGVVAVVLVAVVGTSSSRGAGASYEVRAIFDNAGFAVPGEDVRIAGANVGSIQSLDVTSQNRAAVTMSINDARFTPFYANATCAIRPQSVIGERYVDCEPGSSSSPVLAKITHGPGTGTFLLPVTRTSSPIDSDLVQNIYQQPITQRFAIILSELGTGLAARGSDLNAVIHRADPALGYTDQVLQILARQNRALAQLATDSDAVLGPLSRARHQLSDFVVQANTTSVASATQAANISRTFQLFPQFLRQLRPLMVQLGSLADQGTPLMASLGQAAGALGRQFQNLVPFAQAARPSLINLGAAAAESQPALLATVPLAHQLLKVGNQTLPSAQLLDQLTASLDKTGAIEQLMGVLFNGVGASNAFDQLGHFVRTEPLSENCTGYSKAPVTGCSSNFANAPGAASDAAARRLARAAVRAAGAKQRSPGALEGLLAYLVGNGR